MKKFLTILMTFLLIISSLTIFSVSGFAAQVDDSEQPTVHSLNARGGDFAMYVAMRQTMNEAETVSETFDLFLIVVEDTTKVDHSVDLTVTYTFTRKDGHDKVKAYTLKPDGGIGEDELKLYSGIVAAGEVYRAAENHALFGIEVDGIPYDDFEDLSATVSKDGQVLYESNHVAYGTVLSAKPDEFQALAVKDLPVRWMSLINDDTPINQITIPGTHDSGARSGGSMAQTQEADITAQLEMGVRAFDIRCRVRNGGFSLFHGITQQPDTFDDVLAAYESFLAEHPGETILMSMKQEDETNAEFDSTMQAYIDRNPDLWYLENKIPTLGEVRGKIVLLSRYGGSSAPGIRLDPGFSDNTTFTVNNGVACRVQDHYNLGSNSTATLNTKWSDIEALLNFAHSDDAKNTLCINFTSGYTTLLGIIPNITSVSDDINPKLAEFFASAEKGCYGLLLSDFANADNCNLILVTNFEQ